MNSWKIFLTWLFDFRLVVVVGCCCCCCEGSVACRWGNWRKVERWKGQAYSHDKSEREYDENSIFKHHPVESTTAEWISIIPIHQHARVLMWVLPELVRISIGRISKSFFSLTFRRKVDIPTRRSNLNWSRERESYMCEAKNARKIWERMKSNWGWKCYDRAAHSRLPYTREIST